ncbi:hotdog domain-containing protein, partial [Thauera sp. ZXT1-4]|uniref:hotdog domain-containing protein n=1 Tax=Thauera sp. ZXT1-4 TaxID=3460294 RepID=UPI0040409676
VEFKVNLLAPARGESFLACGRVLRAGRTLTVCQADVFANEGEGRALVAVMLSTIIVRGR